jgi:magnesium transporter
MAQTLIVRPDGSIARNASADEVADAYRHQEGIVWLDYDGVPDAGQLAFLTELFGLGDGAVEHLTEPHRSPRATPFRAYMLTVVYDVRLREGSSTIDQNEVVLLFTERSLVSVHHGTVDALSPFGSQIERALNRFGIEIAAIVFAVLETIAEGYLHALADVKSQIDALELRILQQEEQEGIPQLYHLRRQLTQLRGVIAPEAALIGLHAGQNPFLRNPEIQEAMLDVKHKMQCAVDEIDLYLGMLPDILTTFESIKSDNLNRIVKLLTVWSIILTAVALFPTVMGISLAREPSISPTAGYVLSIGLMALLGGAIWYVFRRQGWTD